MSDPKARKLADELWEKYLTQTYSKIDAIDGDQYMSKHDFLSALREYGEAVRAGDVQELNNKMAATKDGAPINPAHVYAEAAAAIKTMELP
jgi:hypothetical protein